MKHMEHIVLLRLMGNAFAVYQQLKEEDFSQIKSVLCTAFVTDGFLANEQFVKQCLCPGESVDIYLAEL